MAEEVRENLFLLLGLNPDLPHPWPDVAAIISKRRSEWMKKAATSAKHKQFGEWCADAEKIWSDAAALQEQIAAAKQRLANTKKGDDDDLDSQLRVSAAKGYVTEEEIEAISKQTNYYEQPRWTADGVRQRAAKMGLKTQAAESSEPPARKRLDTVEENKIRANLEVLGVGDLYTLLALPRTTSELQLRQKADQELRKIQQRAVKTADVNARQTLFGACLHIFGSGEQRQRYDNSLDAQRFDAIRHRAETAYRGESKLSVATVDELVKQGVELGLKPNDVVAELKHLARQRKWVLEVPHRAASDWPTQCGGCGKASPSGAASCVHCGAAMRRECPKCKTANPTTAQVCGKCQFAVGDMPFAAARVRDARDHLSNGRLAEALKLVDEALQFWPGHEQAAELKREIQQRLAADEAEKKRRDALAKAEKEKRDVLAKEVRDATRDNRLEEARRKLDELRQVAPAHSDLPSLSSEVDRGLQRAKLHVDRGDQLRANRELEDAHDAYQQGLAICRDSAAAREGLKKCPPAPPAKLVASPVSGRVDLDWPKSSSRGNVTYRVVRQVNAAPTHASDGTPLGDLVATRFTDQRPPIGSPCHYAVVAIREGAASTPTATQNPVLSVEEVRDLQIRSKDGCVVLQWKAPAGAKDVEVWRKLGKEPATREDGTRVVGSREEAHDLGLTNGALYGYRVVAVFQDASGGKAHSRGVTCVATPLKPPAPIQDLKLTRMGESFRVEWGAVAAGDDVRIHDRAAPSSHAIGKILSLAELPPLGEALASIGPRTAAGSLAGRTELRLLPVTIRGGVCVLGKELHERWVPEILNLQGEYRDDQLVLIWDWPSGVGAAVIIVRDDHFSTNSNDPKCRRVTAEEYRQSGRRLVLPIPAASKLFVTALAAIDRRGTWEYSPGVEKGTRLEIAPRSRCTALYQIRRGWSHPFREFIVAIRVDRPVELPELVIESKRDGLPTQPGDGTVVLKTAPIKASPVLATEIVINPAPWRLSTQNTTLFHAREEDGRWLELIRG